MGEKSALSGSVLQAVNEALLDVLLLLSSERAAQTLKPL